MPSDDVGPDVNENDCRDTGDGLCGVCEVRACKCIIYMSCDKAEGYMYMRDCLLPLNCSILNTLLLPTLMFDSILTKGRLRAGLAL